MAFLRMSLPDGWGRLLVDRLMKKNGINPHEIGSLERLAVVGNSGMGALTYQPVITMEKNHDEKSLDEIALECEKILSTETCRIIWTLLLPSEGKALSGRSQT